MTDISQYKGTDILVIHFFNRLKGKTHKIQVDEIIKEFAKEGIKKNHILPIKAGAVVYFIISKSQEKIINIEKKLLDTLQKE
jgi:hypothetical protein